MMNKNQGFSLIELMIVVAIIAVLAAIVYPSYSESVRKTKRSHASGALTQLAQAMERHHNETGSYKNATVTNLLGSTTAPLEGGDATYNLSIEGSNDVKYLIKATRTGSMTGDACGDFTYNSVGTAGLENNTGKTVADCWKR